MTMFEKIKKIAKERGYSLSQLNDKAGLKTNVIYSWKTKVPSADKLKAVADVLHVSVDSLLDDNNTTSDDTPSVLFRSLADPDGMSNEEYQAYSDALKRFADFTRRDIEQERKNRE